ncbi:MAG: hypothetical protein QOJ85_1653 [Solirubrobacteraceae bacterium]|nr:hypothetical protein [Solirubrobacteraceae bacterium]
MRRDGHEDQGCGCEKLERSGDDRERSERGQGEDGERSGSRNVTPECPLEERVAG